jgi:hypothetical protein
MRISEGKPTDKTTGKSFPTVKLQLLCELRPPSKRKDKDASDTAAAFYYYSACPEYRQQFKRLLTIN